MRALLVDAPGSVAWLLDSIRPFGDRLGTVLYRVPANVLRNDERLALLLAAWPSAVPLTMEFQDPSWLVDEVLDLLHEHGAAICATDLDDRDDPPSLHMTGEFLYLRLRRTSYDDRALATWAARIVPFLEVGHDVYAFFKHDEVGDAPRLARALVEHTDRLLLAASTVA
jgi:uncharacterized protein YecE (DUF72 family)